jgi:rhodanese-related sulfurtransferase
MDIKWNLLEEVNKFFEQLTPEVIAKRPCRVNPETVLNWIYSDQKVLIVDIRTPNEQSFVGFTYPYVLNIPMNELFNRKNIEKLLQYGDWKIIVACRAGVRSLIATAFLRYLGFNNVYSLEGGISYFAQIVPYG